MKDSFIRNFFSLNSNPGFDLSATPSLNYGALREQNSNQYIVSTKVLEMFL